MTQTIVVTENNSGGNRIHSIDAKTTRDERQINLPSISPTWSIAAHPKQMVFAYVDLEGNAAVAALDDGHTIFQTKVPIESGASFAVRNVKFSPDGTMLAITTNQTFQLWDWANNRQLLNYDAHTFHAQNLSQPIQVPNGSQKLTCTPNSCTSTGPTKASTREEQRYFYFMGSSFSPDGRQLALCSRDELNILQIPSGKKRAIARPSVE